MNTLEITTQLPFSAFSNPPEGITVAHETNTIALSAKPNVWHNFTIRWTEGIAIGVVSAYLYNSIQDHTKENPEGITINEKYIRFEDGKVSEFIEKQITTSKKEE